MKAYKIHRWDSILPPNSSNSLPMIYISADADLLIHAQKNNYILPLEIKGTNSIYDNQPMKGTFDALLLGPNCVSEAIKSKNWYTISLDSYFYAYPPLMGEVVFPGLVPVQTANFTVLDKKKVPLPEVIVQKNFSNPEPKIIGLQGMGTREIVAVISAIVIILILVFSLKSRK